MIFILFWSTISLSYFSSLLPCFTRRRIYFSPTILPYPSVFMSYSFSSFCRSVRCWIVCEHKS